MSVKRAAPSPIPWAGVCWLLLAALALTFFLIPSEFEVLERLEKDGFHQRALQALEAMPPSKRARDSAAYALLELRVRQHLLSSTNLALQARMFERVNQLCVEQGFEKEFFRTYVDWIRALRPETEIDALVLTHTVRLSRQQQGVLVRLLVERALAANDPARAASLHERMWMRDPGDEDATVEFLRLWRLAAQPDRAIAAIEEVITRAGGSAMFVQHYPALAQARVGLFREMGRSPSAFEAARELFQAATPPARDRLDLLVLTAREADRPADVLPLLVPFAEQHPQDVPLWRQVGELAMASGRLEVARSAYERLLRLEPSNSTNAFQMAQLSEWNEAPSQAFDYYLEALVRGLSDVVPRLVLLGTALRRESELVVFLGQHEAAVEAAGYGRFLARLQATTGDWEGALTRFGLLAERDPDDLDLVREYVQLAIDLFQFERVVTLVDRFLARHPQDLILWRARAEALNRLKEYDGAFEAYEHLLGIDSADATLESLLTLAESLGRLDVVIRGLERRLDRREGLTTRDFLRAASAYRLTQNRAGQRDVLARAVAAFPEDAVLRLQWAYALADGGEPLQAVQALDAHEGLRSNLEAARLYLNCLVQAQDLPRAESFLRSGLSAEVLDDPDVMDLHASVMEGNGQLNEAVRLYSELIRRRPENRRMILNTARLLSSLGRMAEAEAMLLEQLQSPAPEVWQLAAQIYAAAGDNHKAEYYQRQFLRTRPRQMPQAWGFLGDILLARGDRKGARVAYTQGIQAFFDQQEANRQP